MTVLDRGLQLLLLVGRTVPRPAGYDVMSAFVSAEVSDSTTQANVFTLTFTLGRSPVLDYPLLRDNVFAPLNRVVIAVQFNALTEVLIDGVVTEQQVASGSRPGEARLVVTGEDLSRMLDRRERSRTFPNQSDADIVRSILGAAEYATLGLRPDVTTTRIRPNETQRVPSQQGTDLATINTLAQRNSYVFYIEPTAVPGQSVAYWGPEKRLGAPQPALTVDMGAETNVESSINFQLNALGPVEHEVGRQEPASRQRLPTPPMAPARPPLARTPAAALRRTIDRRAAPLDSDRAGQVAATTAGRAADALTATGEVNAGRYGRALRARRLVGVRGVGDSFGGLYYVSDVRHTISVGSYRMSFTLSREGIGSTVPVVPV
ncbi:MAG: hypothetical protein KA170_05665 [Candidatus Promineofilum sp.]|nr:hypothetical protein [Promineifilum sp.]